MALVPKRVTFYDTVVDVTDDSGVETTKLVGPKFWPKLMDKLDATKPQQRIQTISSTRYYGKVVLPTSPAIRHLQVGRLRDISEHLEQTNIASGDVGPLLLPDPNLRVSEPTFVVPFTRSGRVAMISPGRQTRQETVGHWITGVLNYAPKGKSVRFIPVIDTDILATVLASQGAVGIEFNFDAGTSLSNTGSQFLNAVEEVRTKGPRTGTVTIGWSLGIDGGSAQDKDLLRKAAEKIIQNKLAKRASANLVVQGADGSLRRETHNLFEDKIVTNVKYKVEADVAQTTESILNAVGKAITEVTKRANPAALGTDGADGADGGGI